MITTERLELVLLGPSFLEDWLAGRPTFDLGFADPAGFLDGAEDFVRLRLEQARNPAVGRWLLRAIVLRDACVAIGTVGFHAALDHRGMVELGYEVLPAYRRRGYASEAASGVMRWATGQGARIARACVSPDNTASLAMIGRLGFVQVGEQIDEEDGRELVFEKPLETTSGAR